MKKVDQKWMLDTLEDTVKFYSEDTSRRAITDNCGCMYITEDGRKCAVGRLMSDEQCRLLEEFGDSVGVVSHCDSFPIELKFPYKIRFLLDLQNLHDNDSFWNEDGITEGGRELVLKIKDRITSGFYESGEG